MRIKRALLIIPSHFTMEAQDLISWLLERDPYSRFGAVGSVQRVLQHCFFYTFKVAGGSPWLEVVVMMSNKIWKYIGKVYDRALIPPIVFVKDKNFVYLPTFSNKIILQH